MATPHPVWLSLLVPLALGMAARAALTLPIPVTTSATGIAAIADELLVLRDGQLLAINPMGDVRGVIAAMPSDTLAVTAIDEGRVYWAEPAALHVLDVVTGERGELSAAASAIAWSCDRLVGLQAGGDLMLTWAGTEATVIPLSGRVRGIFRVRGCGHVGAWTDGEVGQADLSTGVFTAWFSAKVGGVQVLGDRIVTLEGAELVVRQGDALERVPAPGIVEIAGPFATGIAGRTAAGDVLAIPLW